MQVISKVPFGRATRLYAEQMPRLYENRGYEAGLETSTAQPTESRAWRYAKKGALTGLIWNTALIGGMALLALNPSFAKAISMAPKEILKMGALFGPIGVLSTGLTGGLVGFIVDKIKGRASA